MDITYDQLDAVLRDPQVPGDVRAAVQTEISVRNYLSRVDFHESDAGVTSVTYRDNPPPVSEAAPSSAQTTTPPPETATPPDSPTGAQAPVPESDVPPPPPPAETTGHPLTESEMQAELSSLTPEERAKLRAALDAADTPPPPAP